MNPQFFNAYSRLDLLLELSKCFCGNSNMLRRLLIPVFMSLGFLRCQARETVSEWDLNPTASAATNSVLINVCSLNLRKLIAMTVNAQLTDSSLEGQKRWVSGGFQEGKVLM